jgi:fucose permease
MNDSFEFSKPILIEPGVKSFLKYTLKQCHDIKTQYYNTVYNIFLLFVFIFVLVSILFFKYKGKPTKEEIENRNREKQQYILSKIQNFQEAKKHEHQKIIQADMITGLPHFELH